MCVCVWRLDGKLLFYNGRIFKLLSRRPRFFCGDGLSCAAKCKLSVSIDFVNKTLVWMSAAALETMQEKAAWINAARTAGSFATTTKKGFSRDWSNEKGGVNDKVVVWLGDVFCGNISSSSSSGGGGSSSRFSLTKPRFFTVASIRVSWATK